MFYLTADNYHVVVRLKVPWLGYGTEPEKAMREQLADVKELEAQILRHVDCGSTKIECDSYWLCSYCGCSFDTDPMREEEMPECCDEGNIEWLAVHPKENTNA